MPMLIIEPSKLHRRKVLDCTTKAPSSQMWGVNKSFPHTASSSLCRKTPRTPKVSRNLMHRAAFTTSPPSFPDPETMICNDRCLYLTKYQGACSVSSMEPSIPNVSNTLKLQRLQTNGNDRSESPDQIYSDELVPGLRHSLLRVRGKNIYQPCILPTGNLDWQQTIDAIKCSNDAMRKADERQARDEEIALPRPSNRKQTGLPHQNVMPGLSTAPRMAEADRCKRDMYAPRTCHAAKPWSEKTFGLGRSLHNIALNPEDDKLAIDDVRRILLQSKRFEYGDESRPEHLGQFTFTPQAIYFCNIESPIRSDANNVEAPQAVYRKDIPGLESKVSTVKRPLRFGSERILHDHETKVENVPGYFEDKMISIHLSDDGWADTTITGETIPEKAVSVEENIEDLTNPDDAHFPNGPWMNFTSHGAEVLNTQKAKHHGLELIDKIKDTQQLLARIHVNSHRLSESSSKEPFSPECHTRGSILKHTHGDRATEHRKNVPEFCRMRLETLGLPLTRATVSSQRRSRPPHNFKEDFDYSAGGDGDNNSVKGPCPSMTYTAQQSKLNKEIIASLENTLDKADPKIKIFSWLQNVQPLAKRQKSLRAK